MLAQLAVFGNSLGELDILAAAIRREGRLPMSSSPDPSSEIVRRLGGQMAFVSLFAAFERLIDNSIESLVRRLFDRLGYAKLPGNLIVGHLKSVSLFTRTQHLLRRASTTEADAWRNVVDCFKSEGGVFISHLPFVTRPQSYRREYIDEALLRVGIENACDRAVHSKFLQDWLHSRGYVVGDRTNLDRVSRELDRLIELRNQFAHSVSEDVPVGELEDFIAFVRALGTSIAWVIQEHSVLVEDKVKPSKLPSLVRESPNPRFLAGRRLPRQGDWLVITKRDASRSCVRIEAAKKLAPIPGGVGTLVEIEIDARAKKGWAYSMVRA